MRCVRCQSENMPGRERCFKCGSVLAAGGITDVHPPRMPAWSRPFRTIRRWVREHRTVPEDPSAHRIRQEMARVASDVFLGTVLGVVPGLAHALHRRFKEVRLLVLLWAILLSVGLFLYGSDTGFLLTGLAVGLHAWIAIQYKLFDEITDWISKIAMLLVVVVGLTVVYWAVPRVVFPGFTGAHTALTIPKMNIQTGDYLIVRRTGHLENQLTRGTLVLVRPLRFRNAQADIFQARRNRILGQVIGVPGDRVRIVDRAFAIGDRILDPEQFPLPRWLRGRALNVTLHTDSYFVSTEYTIGGHGGVLTSQVIVDACVVKASDIEGWAFYRWWPLQRRGFIE